MYDAKRKYGLYYDLETVSTVELQFHSGKVPSSAGAEIFDEREGFYQQLWKRYFGAVNIKARKT
ncbi:DUF4130 domain-containing protein [Arcticibacter pallidicorallinus]|uniref:DUF4130 domain-containing protein n=1 Tax=Arcticibacter pallidicorallinus TaxID=1259464 RepID=UPI001C62719A